MLLLFGTFHDLRDLNHEPDLAKELGNMVVAWSLVDNALILVLHKITGMAWPMSAAAYYQIPTFQSRIKVLCALLKEWEMPTFDAKAVGKQIIGLNRLARARNDWVHGSWAARNGDNATHVFDMRAEKDSDRRCLPVQAHMVKNHNEAVLKRIDQIRALLA